MNAQSQYQYKSEKEFNCTFGAPKQSADQIMAWVDIELALGHKEIHAYIYRDNYAAVDQLCTYIQDYLAWKDWQIRLRNNKTNNIVIHHEDRVVEIYKR